MTRLRRAAAMLSAASLLFGAACSQGSDNAATPSVVCTNPAEIKMPGGIPDDFPWPDGIALTEAHSTKEFVTLEGFGKGAVDDYFDSAEVGLRDKGFDIVNTDYEGFEAELYFAKGNSLAGITSLREGPCDGYVKVNVVYDPLDTAAGRKAVRKTRRLSGQGGQNDSP